MQSDGYKFLKAVKDRDGTVATELLNQPGSTIVNARDIATGQSALHYAVQRRDLAWIRFLLQKGANPNIADKSGVAPLQIATQLGFIEGLEALVDGGATVDIADSTGETPLIGAIHRRDTAMVKLLLENGANADRTDNSGRSARDYAMLMGPSSTMMQTIEGAEKDRGEKAPVYGPS
ncbi:ankyrin repeat domain-containing protein [Erythrobacter litoralis]|nr:ankyrin repeat domain-containing protein [Erythrobacter litoralis]